MTEELTKMVMPLTPTKFGYFTLFIISIMLIVMKTMIIYNIGVNTGFYNIVSAFVIVIPFFIAIAMVLILYRFMKNIWYIGITFLIFLIISFVYISPILVGGA